jgi:hypothetical protein
MASSNFEVRISLEKLLIVLIVVLVPLNFIGLYLAIDSTRAAEQTTGALFRSIAQDQALAARHFIDDRVIEVAAITSDPTVLRRDHQLDPRHRAPGGGSQVCQDRRRGEAVGHAGIRCAGEKHLVVAHFGGAAPSPRDGPAFIEVDSGG